MEIDEIIEKGIDEQRVEPFDDGSYQVDMEILQKIYTKGYREAQEDAKQKHGE